MKTPGKGRKRNRIDLSGTIMPKSTIINTLPPICKTFLLSLSPSPPLSLPTSLPQIYHPSFFLPLYSVPLPSTHEGIIIIHSDLPPSFHHLKAALDRINLKKEGLDGKREGGGAEGGREGGREGMLLGVHVKYTSFNRTDWHRS